MDVSILMIDGVNIPHTQKPDLVLGKPFYIEKCKDGKWDIFTHSITLPADIYDRIKNCLYMELVFQTSHAPDTSFIGYRGFTEYCAATSVKRDGDKVHLRQARFRLKTYMGVKPR
ncbi:hypothetical protein [Bacillus phage CP-51]|uniref:Uncharacterized protein n=1 Tax=Bacillus phage CP-51 TaxID=1391188 RepID=A0A068EPG6_9CAUD|nr:hypothetical protein OZ73_gp189 [Bacillus phage CP-51]AID50624.1 hypothetical protein [Bacillus phage CP-51]